MKYFMAVFILAFWGTWLMPFHEFVQSAMDDGKKFGKEMKPIVEQATTAPVNANTVPGFQTDSPVEKEYYDNPLNMETNAAGAAISDPAAQSIQDSMDFRPTVEPEAVEAFLGLGFEAQDNPDVYVSGFSGEYGECVELPVGAGDETYYVRTCNEGLAIKHMNRSCSITLSHQFDILTAYRCRFEGANGSFPACDFDVFSACQLVDVLYFQ